MNTLKHLDNIDTKRGLKKALVEFMEQIECKLDGHVLSQAEAFEWQSRSGFAAHNHNRGGFDFISIRDIYTIETHRLNKHESALVDNAIAYSYKLVKEDNPKMSQDEIVEVCHNEAGEYDDVAYRVRVMYTGNNTVEVFSGLDFDAPYFRWSNKSSFTKVIKFKTIKDLKTQLNKVLTLKEF